MSPQQRGEEAVAAFQEALGRALSIGKTIGGMQKDFEAFQDATREYVVAQAAFNIACVEAINADPDKLKRTVRHFAGDFVVE